MRFAAEVNGHAGPDPEEFNRLTPATRAFLLEVDTIWKEETGTDMELTSILRPGEDSLHADARAADARTRDLRRAVIASLVFRIRRRFPDFPNPRWRPGRRVPKRLVSALYHQVYDEKTGAALGWHMHLASSA